MTKHNLQRIPPFRPYPIRFALPAVYNDELSYYELLAKIEKWLGEVVKNSNTQDAAIEAITNALTDLVTEWETFKEGGYLGDFANFANQWIDSNMERIITDSISHVYFGISADGHWCAYVPESWLDIQFDYGAVYGRSDYMRLILRMNVESPNAIDNTYSYSLNSRPSDFEQLVRDVEVTANRGDATYDAVFTNMNEVVSNGNF